MGKPDLILRIEKDFRIHLSEAKVWPGDDPLSSLKPYMRDKSTNRNIPRYAFEGERLIGLNLGETGLDNNKWLKLLELLGSQAGNLNVLNLSDNQLTEFRLPRSMQNLGWLNIDDNPLTFPATETLIQGQAATLRYLKNLITQGEREVYEVKMLIVGEGGTGKTTLWHKLQDPKHPVPLPKEKQPVTEGINIKEGWKFEHLDLKGTPFLVNLWDFGGQEIQYMTHQFFLTRRSLYVLLADGRREVSNFSYWFKAIHLLGCEKDLDSPLPLLVVLNKKDNEIAEFPAELSSLIEEFPHFDVIKREVDFSKYDGRQQALFFAIKNTLCHQMAHLPLKFPAYWEAVRNKLRELTEDEVAHITYEQFQEICRKNKIETEQEMRDLSDWLHNLGVILHYKDEGEGSKLEDFVVLKPQWAVDAVYKILCHKSVQENQGRFTPAFLTQEWRKHNYSAFERGHLTNLLEKEAFEVCFQAREQDKPIYIVPQQLPTYRPPFDFNPGKSVLQYIYQYPFMPKGFIGRLIVRLHEHLVSGEDEKKVLWKKGMLLQDREDACRALVQETTDNDTGGTIIQITITGPRAEDRKNLLRDIRKELDYLHQGPFSALKFEEKIPCCCKLCREPGNTEFYDRNHLERAREKGKSTVECRKSFEDVPLKALLEGVYGEDHLPPTPHPLKDRISQGEITSVLVALLDVLPEEKHDTVILLQGQMKDLEAKLHLNLINQQEAGIERERIRIATLTLCNEIPK